MIQKDGYAETYSLFQQKTIQGIDFYGLAYSKTKRPNHNKAWLSPQEPLYFPRNLCILKITTPQPQEMPS